MSSSENHVLTDLVEPLNEYVHVPVASRLVRVLFPTPITPDQVTYISVFCGLGAACGFAMGTASAALWGGLLMEAGLILDCVDGQLARMRGTASDWGRLVDGIGGYVANLAVVAGIWIGYPGNTVALLLLTTLMIFRAVAYDFCKQYMTALIHDGEDGGQIEIKNTVDKITSSPSPVLRVYFYYLQFQQVLFFGKFKTLSHYKSQSGENTQPRWSDQQRRTFYDNNKTLFKIWRWNGPDLIFFLIALSGVLGIIGNSLWPLVWITAIQLTAMFILHHSLLRHETVS